MVYTAALRSEGVWHPLAPELLHGEFSDTSLQATSMWIGEIVGMFHWKPSNSDYFLVQLCQEAVDAERIGKHDGVRSQHPSEYDALLYLCLSDTFCLCRPHEILRSCLSEPNLCEGKDASLFAPGVWVRKHGDPSRGNQLPTFYVKMHNLH